MLVKEGEPVDFLGILVQGEAFVMVGQRNIRSVGLGDMTGHMFVADLNFSESHATSLVAKTDGMLAVVPLGELKLEQRRMPDATFQVLKLASKYAMETFMFNLHGAEQNPLVRHPPTAQMTKKLRDFYFKNEEMREFLKGVERRDEKFIVSALINAEFEPGERVMMRDARDRCILIVAEGTLVSFSASGSNRTYGTGSIIGCEQFLFNQRWDSTFICGRQAVVCKLRYESMLDLIKS